MTPAFRSMIAADVPGAFHVCLSTREGSYQRDALAAAGITEDSTVHRLDVARSHQGWVCEVAGTMAGFAMGDAHTGELWVLAVLPDYEKRGIGAKLYELTTAWLASRGWKQLWLAVLPEVQKDGHAFFQRRGWHPAETRGPFLVMHRILVSA